MKDLEKKMVFMGGPRQCGKTTLSKELIQKKIKSGLYFNYDSDEDRREMLAKRWHVDNQLIVLDEIHKYYRWKNWIKGIYDTRPSSQKFLITGSARLDLYRRGGDSLLGRYHYWRLHPFTLSENPLKLKSEAALDRFMRFGGFPEPYLDGDETFARRWRKDRFDRVIRDDLRDLEPIKNISALTLFVEMLRTRVGSPIVLNHIAADLQVSQATLKHWLEILEHMYLIFIVRPFTKNLARAIQKPPKVFFFDNADVIGDDGAVFENLVATHLVKKVHFLEDSTGYRYALHYVRDKEHREVDFVVTQDGNPVELIEAKYADPQIASALNYFARKLNVHSAHQVVGKLKRPYSSGKIHVERATHFLSASVWK